MNTSNKTLGLAAIIASPFLLFQMLLSGEDNSQHNSIGGVFDLIYMMGWMCSTTALIRLQATGSKKAGVKLLYLQLLLLSIANVWNVWVIVAPTYQPIAFYVLDAFWPLSNVCMLAAGIVVAVTGKLKGWKRYSVLIVGLWLPVMMLTMMILGRTEASFFIGGLYSALAWALLGWTVYTTNSDERQLRLVV